jgi:hypothetical protein
LELRANAVKDNDRVDFSFAFEAEIVKLSNHYRETAIRPKLQALSLFGGQTVSLTTRRNRLTRRNRFMSSADGSVSAFRNRSIVPLSLYI